ncbi:MAG: acylphosphatase [Gammaproteobacteria bacterium]|nr:acylphosphatase [Gammaproteobacteria bacterium]
MTPTRVCKRFFIAGRVQGVWFRASTAKEAQARNLVGWVRNLPDGRVEVLAGGNADAIQSLTDWLWQGPRLADVQDVSVTAEPLELILDMQDFRTA